MAIAEQEQPLKRSAFVNPPLQQRSRDSLNRVLRAGLEVLQTDGFDGFTVQKVSQLSNVSIGSIYARIPNRESLILAIYEWAMAWAEEAGRQFEESAGRIEGSPRESIEMVVGDFVRIHLAHSDEWRVFIKQAPLHPEIFLRGQEKTLELREHFTQALLRNKEHFRHGDANLATTIAFSMIFSTITRRISHGAEFDGSEVATDERLAEELGRAVADYLLVG